MAKYQIVVSNYVTSDGTMTVQSFYAGKAKNIKKIKEDIIQFFNNNPGAKLIVLVADKQIELESSDEVFLYDCETSFITKKQFNNLDNTVGNWFGYASIMDVHMAIADYTPESKGAFWIDVETYNGEMLMSYKGEDKDE